MSRKLVLALGVLAMTSGSLLAGEIRGTLKSVDRANGTVVVTTPDQQDRTIEIGQNTPTYGFVTVGRRRRVSTQVQQVGQGMNALQPGMAVNITTETRDGVERATQISQDTGSYGSSGRGRRRR